MSRAKINTLINKIIQGDALEVLKRIPSNSIDTIITSPPYFSCRSYLSEDDENKKYEIGLEDHPQEYIDKIVAVCLECVRVLKKSGVFFLNLGDVFYTSTHQGGYDRLNKEFNKIYNHRVNVRGKYKSNWLQPKGRLLLPFRIAITLQDKGIIIRDVIIWVKKLTKYPERTSIGATIPFPVRDRLLPAFEYIFQIVKSKKYYFDLEPIKNEMKDWKKKENMKYSPQFHKTGTDGLKNFIKKIVNWNIKNVSNESLKSNPTNAVMFTRGNQFTVPQGHYAKFPESLVEFFILAGCPREVCKKCGKPRERITKYFEKPKNTGEQKMKDLNIEAKKRGEISRVGGTTSCKPGGSVYSASKETISWTIPCNCNAGYEPGIVLDPFMGSGTTAVVAKKLGRNFIGIELNPTYISITRTRLDAIKRNLELFQE